MKPKILTEIYKNNTGVKKERASNVGHFLANGEMVDGSKKNLSDSITYNIKGNIITRKYKEMLEIGLESKERDMEEFLEKYGIIYSESAQIEEFDIAELKTYTDILKRILSNEFGIIIDDGTTNGKVYKMSDSKKIIAGESLNKLRKIMLLNDSDYVIFHELIHHITQLYLQIVNMDNKKFYFHTLNGYSHIFISRDNDKLLVKLGNALNEGITEIITYKALKEYNNTNLQLMINGNSYYIFVIAKLMDLASERLQISKEYIYKHIIRGYFIKGYKGLSVFYEAFGGEFVRSLMKMHTSDESVGISPYYKELGFESKDELFEYFDIKNLPSQEISDIMGIER